MLVDESRRLTLLDRLREVLGEEEARTLIECLPPVRWEQLATKDDVKASEDRIRTEMNGKFANVDGKFAQVEAGFERVWAEFATVRGELAEHRGELAEHRGEIALQMARQTRTLVFIMSGFMLTIWGTLLGVGLT
ncbi:MAG: hypothetical protein OXT07_07905 [bacterium]|nr:hypothetical protein [bacterium]MDE0216600.1 hypothetical protein [bacterium]